MVTNGAGQVLYLVNPAPSMPDAQGRDLPANGELHLSNPFGVDITLGAGVPAFGYAFSPDQRWALFLTKTKTFHYALNLAPLEGPELHAPTNVVAIADGLQNAALFQQAFFTPSGHYLITGVLPKNVAVSADLHVVEMGSGTDVFALTNGAFDYQEQVTLDDTMIFANSTASTMPGVPSVEGLYMINLAAAPSVKPALIDTHVTNFSHHRRRAEADLRARERRPRHVRVGAERHAAAGVGRDRVLAGTVAARTGGLHDQPIRRCTCDRSSSRRPSPPSPDRSTSFSPIQFSPDAQHLYWFKNVSSQNGTGDLYHAPLPLAAAAAPSLMATNASTRDFHFVGDRLVYLTNVDAAGTTGDVTVAALDGSGARVVAHGAATGRSPHRLPRRSAGATDGTNHLWRDRYGARDRAAGVRTPERRQRQRQRPPHRRHAPDPRRPGVGRADLSTGGAEQVLATNVRSGGFELSDDSYVLSVDRRRAVQPHRRRLRRHARPLSDARRRHAGGAQSRRRLRARPHRRAQPVRRRADGEPTRYLLHPLLMRAALLVAALAGCSSSSSPRRRRRPGSTTRTSPVAGNGVENHDCRSGICKHNENTDLIVWHGDIWLVHRTAESQILGPNSSLHIYRYTSRRPSSRRR